MVLDLSIWEIISSYFTFDFLIVEGVKKLSETEKGFLLPLHLLEAGFHLSLHLFFCTVLQEYRIALGQLTNFSFFISIVYFIDYCLRNEPLLLFIFQSIY